MKNGFSHQRRSTSSFHSVLCNTVSRKAGARFLLTGLALLLVCFAVNLRTEANTSPSCECNRNAPDVIGARFKPNSTLRVMLRKGDFSAEESAAFQESIRLWQAVLPQSGTGIDLQMGGEIEGNNCTNCIIVKRKAEMQGTYAALTLLSTQGDLYSKAVINIKANVHKTELLRMVFTHELGHAFGLDDCPDCKGNTTVMNSVNKYAFGKFSFLAPRSKMALAPTPCDIARVSAGYSAAISALAASTGSAPVVKDQVQARSVSPAAPVAKASTGASTNHHANRPARQAPVKIEQLVKTDSLGGRD